MAPNQREVTVNTLQLHERCVVQFWPSVSHATLRSWERDDPPSRKRSLAPQSEGRATLYM